MIHSQATTPTVRMTARAQRGKRRTRGEVGASLTGSVRKASANETPTAMAAPRR